MVTSNDTYHRTICASVNGLFFSCALVIALAKSPLSQYDITKVTNFRSFDKNTVCKSTTHGCLRCCNMCTSNNAMLSEPGSGVTIFFMACNLLVVTSFTSMTVPEWI